MLSMSGKLESLSGVYLALEKLHSLIAMSFYIEICSSRKETIVVEKLLLGLISFDS